MKEFEGQHDNEAVLFVFRRHIIAMRKGFYMLVIPFVITSLPTLVLPILPIRLSGWWADPINMMLVSFSGLLVGLVLFFYHWMGWYFSVYIVTDQRMRQIDQQGIFGKSVIDLGLTKIQNISYNVEGFTAAVFGFGTIVIQTYVGDLIIDKVHHPEQIYNKLQDAVRKTTEDRQDKQLHEEITS